VILTDSMETDHYESGTVKHVPAAQKLFRVDDRTVCAIAGFGFESLPTKPTFNTDLAGILADFRDQLSQQPVPRFDAKLRALAFLVAFYINTSATLKNAVEGSLSSRQIHDYESDLILAGYDENGKPELGKVVITEILRSDSRGDSFWDSNVASAEVTVGPELVHFASGYQDEANRVFDSPEDFASSPAVQTYARSRTADRGESLSITEMKALAEFIAKKTARSHPEVGGPNQIAILGAGAIIKFQQPIVQESKEPIQFSIIQGGRWLAPPVSVPRGAGKVVLLIGLTVDGVRGLELRGLFFYDCEIRNSIVTYSGGPTTLDPLDKDTVVGSWLLPVPPIDTAADKAELSRLEKGFAWRADEPN
jgi:hypothetical protein